MADQEVTTIRIVNVPSYTSEADFNNWFLFAHGFQDATLDKRPRAAGSSQTGWAKFESVETAHAAIQSLEGRQLTHCPEGSVLRVEWAKKNFKPTNPLKKRPRPDEDVYGGGLAGVPDATSWAQQGYLAGAPPAGVPQPPPPVAKQWLPQAAPPVSSASMALAGMMGGATDAAHHSRNSSTLYVGRLSTDVGEQDFMQLFGMCEGFERLKYVAPNEGKSGMCFAKFHSPEYAEKARVHVASFALPSNPGQPLQVTFAKNDLDQPSHRGPAPVAAPPVPMASFHGGFSPLYDTSSAVGVSAHSAGGGGHSDTMFIGNLAASVTEQEIVNALTTLHGFVRVKFVGEGTQRPMAFVLFDSVNSCGAGIASLHGNALPSAPAQAITCQYAKNSLDKPTPKFLRQA